MLLIVHMPVYISIVAGSAASHLRLSRWYVCNTHTVKYSIVWFLYNRSQQTLDGQPQIHVG